MFKKKEKTVKIPDKTTMNLYQVETKGNNIPLFILGIVVVLGLSFVIAQFTVINRYNKLNALQSEVLNMQNELDSMTLELTKYPTVKEEYIRYSDSYTSGTTIIVDRIHILDILEGACDGLGTMTQINISGNSVSIVVLTSTTEDCDAIKNNLDNHPNVTYVTPLSHVKSSSGASVVNRLNIGVKEVEE